MKKLFAGLLVGLILLPQVSFAMSDQDHQAALETMISLLQQEVQLLTKLLSLQLTGDAQTITSPVSISPSQSQSAPSLGSVAESIPACVEHPVLTLSANEQIKYRDTTPNQTKAPASPSLRGTYTTGCPLNTNLHWSLSADDGRMVRVDGNNLDEQPTFYDYWDLQGIDGVFRGRPEGAGFATTTTYTLTVGDLVATTTVVLQ